MGNTAIQVDHLSKQYRIGSLQQGGSKYKSLREELMKAIRAPIRRAGRLLRGEPYGAAELDETIWALKDVSFEVKHGEAVGIIGANGAGKTTLLKILSRITEPTEGRAVLHGRVGSLLEVGTGFHPELTGRENIYLNGAILGMRKTEIERKFDEIVAFSGVEQFIDTPVKHYSSGMRVRLAFSVAAHLDPEILLIDEVLAVGDAAFQKKCLGKMGEVAREGRTVLFVSHNMAAIQNLCDRGLVLNSGNVALVGTQAEAVNFYLQGAENLASSFEEVERSGSGVIRFTKIEFRDDKLRVIEAAQSGQGIRVLLYYQAASSYAYSPVHVGLTFATQLGVRVFSQSTRMTGTSLAAVPPKGVFVCHLPKLPLPPSTYRVDINVKVSETYADRIAEAASLAVVGGDFFGSGRVPSVRLGVCLVEGSWEVKETPCTIK